MLSALEARLVSRLALTELALPPDKASAQGNYRGEPVSLRARAWAGPGVRWARSVFVEGAGLEIANLLCLPDPDRTWPLLGIDLVGLGRDTAIAVADLTPVTDDASEQLTGLAARRARHVALPSAGALPAWCEAFSPHALFVRITPNEAATVKDQLLDFVDALADLVPTSRRHPELQEGIADRQRAYLRSHLKDDKGLLLLEKMFGAPWARPFLTTVMFPEEPR